MRLTDLEVGEVAKVKKVDVEDAALRKRLKAMGIVKGERVKIEKVAPLGDPIEVVVKGFRCSLRRSEAEYVLVEKL